MEKGLQTTITVPQSNIDGCIIPTMIQVLLSRGCVAKKLTKIKKIEKLAGLMMVQPYYYLHFHFFCTDIVACMF